MDGVREMPGRDRERGDRGQREEQSERGRGDGKVGGTNIP